jgi:hypothetical protein
VADIQELDGGQWPAGVQRLFDELVAATKLELTQTRRAPGRSSDAIAQWVQDWRQADTVAVAISRRIRRALNLPQLFPVPRST